MPPQVDLYDPRTFVDGVPHAEFARLLRDEPVFWHDERPMLGWPAGPGFWGVVRHSDVQYVNRHPDLFSSHLGATQIRDPAPEDLAFVREMMLNMDPPDHTRLRRVVARLFTPRQVRAMRGRMEVRAARIVDAVADRRECDFAQDLASDLPLLTLAEVMGVPEEDRRLLYDWSNRIIGYQDDEYRDGTGPEMESGPRVNPRSRAALEDMFDYAHALAEQRRQHPGDDVLSVLLTSDVDGEALTVAQFENFFFLLAVAGNETLRNAIPGGMLSLFEHPGQLQRLLDNPGLLTSAVNEMLRYHTPVVHFRRTATRDTELGGRAIAAGDKVVVFYTAANRDPAVFTEPERFDVDRTPNPHLSFGLGPHLCLGASLAVMQMEVMFDEILRRLPGIRLAGEPVRLASSFQAGFKRLPVGF